MKEDIEQLRQLIRDFDLTWLDEELDEIIFAGKQRTKEIFEGKKKSFSGIEQVGYSDREQLEIIKTALKNYFVTLPMIQSETTKAFSECLKISTISFKELDSSDFKKIDSNTKKIDTLLNQIKE